MSVTGPARTPTVPDFRDIQMLLHPEWILRDTLTPLLPSHVSCSPAHSHSHTHIHCSQQHQGHRPTAVLTAQVHRLETITQEDLARSWRSQQRLAQSGTEHSQANWPANCSYTEPLLSPLPDYFTTLVYQNSSCSTFVSSPKCFSISLLWSWTAFFLHPTIYPRKTITWFSHPAIVSPLWPCR